MKTHSILKITVYTTLNILAGASILFAVNDINSIQKASQTRQSENVPSFKLSAAKQSQGASIESRQMEVEDSIASVTDEAESLLPPCYRGSEETEFEDGCHCGVED